ncbi:MAG: TIGR04255 family protein [Bacteroidota bacterium]|jgi:uncharacterized protein (TIGR04255 family)|nr:TIGR04255 family protein [Bacteroidota bacterium]
MKNESMKLPKKITPCPIVEALVEVRFESDLPGEAIFGIIYNAFQKEFPKFDKLPILELPDQIRSNDPNLKYLPHYKLSVGDYIIQVGPKVFSFSNINEYVGWEVFYKEISLIFKKINELRIIKETQTWSFRCINIFPEINIFEKSDLNITLKKNRLEKDINLLINLPSNGFVNVLRMVSFAELVSGSGKLLRGSVIDIDTKSSEKSSDCSDMERIISAAHLEEKKLFFSLLEDEYIKSLKPEY